MLAKWVATEVVKYGATIKLTWAVYLVQARMFHSAGMTTQHGWIWLSTRTSHLPTENVATIHVCTVGFSDKRWVFFAQRASWAFKASKLISDSNTVTCGISRSVLELWLWLWIWLWLSHRLSHHLLAHRWHLKPDHSHRLRKLQVWFIATVIFS